jgi:glycerol-3-phosphate acyltransferase PlsX
MEFKIGIDAMGSDHAPAAELLGTFQALNESSELRIVLIGKKDALKNLPQELASRIEIIDAPLVVTMGESATEALRHKRNSSIGIGINLLKEKKIDALVSMGNTGAIMAYAIAELGKIPKLDRPGLAAFFPTPQGHSLVIDIGANVNTKPLNLYQFAFLGTLAFRYLYNKPNPSIGLLNIGNEENKGPEVVQLTYQMLKKSPLNFIGNIEGYDILKGKCDVIVCDGFIGNIILKFGEGIAETLNEIHKSYLISKSKYRFRRWVSKPVLAEFLSRMNYEEYGGALLLGICGTVIVGHGRSSPRAIKNAIKTAISAVRSNITEHITQEFPKEFTLS